jgi:hypothetical protein
MLHNVSLSLLLFSSLVDKIRGLGFTTLHDSRLATLHIPRCLKLTMSRFDTPIVRRRVSRLPLGVGRARGRHAGRLGNCVPTCPFWSLTFDELLSRSVLLKRPLWWASLYSRALTTICVDEVPAPRSRPTTVRQGNGGL